MKEKHRYAVIPSSQGGVQIPNEKCACIKYLNIVDLARGNGESFTEF